MPRDCADCDGNGWVIEAGHSCGGNERLCHEFCPVQVQVPCETCSPLVPSYPPDDEEPF